MIAGVLTADVWRTNVHSTQSIHLGLCITVRRWLPLRFSMKGIAISLGALLFREVCGFSFKGFPAQTFKILLQNSVM